MTTEQATQQAIVAAVRAFVERVEQRAYRSGTPGDPWAIVRALDDELAALERAAAEGAPEGGSQKEETARE